MTTKPFAKIRPNFKPDFKKSRYHGTLLAKKDSFSKSAQPRSHFIKTKIQIDLKQSRFTQNLHL